MLKPASIYIDNLCNQHLDLYMISLTPEEKEQIIDLINRQDYLPLVFRYKTADLRGTGITRADIEKECQKKIIFDPVEIA